MSITLKNIKEQYCMYQKHEQVGSKQLFICSAPFGRYKQQIFVSYLTVVGYYDEVLGAWVLTRHKYSPTTSKQLTQFARGKDVTWVNDVITYY